MTSPDDLTDLFDEAMSATQQPAEHPITVELSTGRQRYHGAARLAQGGLKRIETVEDRDTGRTLAIARPRHDSAEAREAFLREARITANLTHPNIIPVYDIGIDEHDQPYFTMKLIDGDNLADSVRNRTSPTAVPGINDLATRVDHFLKVCDAIAYAHSRGVIHLDLKPENIQLGRFGEVLVCDWGLSKIQDESCEDPHLERYSFDAHERRNLTLGGSIKGTPGYMAPEQCGAFNSRKDHRTDVFSLGCILYEIASFRRPIATTDVRTAVRNTQGGKLRPVPDTVQPGLAAVISKALQYRPENRYQSVDALIRDLSAWRNGFATSAERPGLSRQLALFYRRHRLACILTGTFLAILALTIGLFVIRLQRSERAARAALAQAQWEQEQRQLLGNQASPLLIARAHTAFRRGRFDETQNLLDGLFSIDPENAEINNLQTDVYFARGQMARANNYLQPQTPFQKSLTQWLRTRPGSPETPLSPQEITTLIALIDERQPSAGMGFLIAWLYHEDPVVRHTVEAAIAGWSLPEDTVTLLELAPELAPPVANSVVRRFLRERDRLPPGAIEQHLPTLLAMDLPQDTKNLLVAGPRINLALASRITATRTKANPETLVDGDLSGNNRWRSVRRPSEITIDLRSVKTVGTVALYPTTEMPAHSINVSVDGTTYRTIEEVPTLPPPSGERPYVHRFEPEQIRFIRVTFPDYQQRTPVELREIQIFGPQANLALGRPTVAAGGNEHHSHLPSYAVNGQAPLNQYWERNDPPASLTVELDQEHKINEVRTAFYHDGNRYYQYRIETSIDGKTFELAADRSGNGIPSTAAPYVDEFEARMARYVRITVIHNSANPGLHIREIEIFPAPHGQAAN